MLTGLDLVKLISIELIMKTNKYISTHFIDQYLNILFLTLYAVVLTELCVWGSHHIYINKYIYIGRESHKLGRGYIKQ